LFVMEECSHTKELLFEEKECLVDHLQTELIEVKNDRDRLLQLFEQQKLTVQRKPLEKEAEKVVQPSPSDQPLQPQQFEPFEEHDSDSSHEGNVSAFKCPPGFRELQKRVDKFLLTSCKPSVL